MNSRVVAILTFDGSACRPYVRLAASRAEGRPLADIPNDHWPVPHIAAEAARSFLEEEWAQLTHIASRSLWVAEIGTGDDGGCSGEGPTAEGAVLALWEDVLGMDRDPPGKLSR